MIVDNLDGKKFEKEIGGALEYHDEIRHAISKRRYILEKNDLRTEKTIVRAVPLPTYLIKALKRDCVLSSIEDLGETQTDSVELNVTQVHEEIRIERHRVDSSLSSLQTS